MKAEETTFRTIVEVKKWTCPMRKEQRFVLLGSCFAQNIGGIFQNYGFDVVTNPFGAAYNPESVAIQIKQALQGEAELPLFQTNGEWHCWLTNTLFGDTEEARFRHALQDKFRAFGDALRQADFIFITLGTNVCYSLRENGLTVTNCHKQPDRLFEETALDVGQCVGILNATVELLQRHCPSAKIVFTVSPFRYRKYGYHGSQLAKATLLLAVNELCGRFPDSVLYFPAYELVLDDLRDYRFYAEDMLHPSPAAVGYIWQRLVENCMDAEMQKYIWESPHKLLSGGTSI